MSSSFFLYEKLDVWKFSMDFVAEIYEILHGFPTNENFILNSQIKRAAISIPSYIAEGTGGTSIKEKIHYIDISNGSLYEVLCQMTLAKRLGHIDEDNYKNIRAKATKITMMLGGLRRSFTTQQNKKQDDNE